jgi:hypothetical protein
VREGRKNFFSEEKKQKTFISALADGAGLWPPNGKLRGIKVFWFFFSKKNILAFS